MNYTVYNAVTGEIQSVFTISDESQVEVNLAGKTWVEGNYSANQYYIENGQPVVKIQQPEDGAPYDFDWITKTWILNQDQYSDQQRILRNQMLSAVDRVNPVWFNTLTPQQQQDLITYRQLLLSVPQQSGFPADINWPAKPSWL
jgi:hypothetical protein